MRIEKRKRHCVGGRRVRYALGSMTEWNSCVCEEAVRESARSERQGEGCYRKDAVLTFWSVNKAHFTYTNTVF